MEEMWIMKTSPCTRYPGFLVFMAALRVIVHYARTLSLHHLKYMERPGFYFLFPFLLSNTWRKPSQWTNPSFSTLRRTLLPSCFPSYIAMAEHSLGLEQGLFSSSHEAPHDVDICFLKQICFSFSSACSEDTTASYGRVVGDHLARPALQEFKSTKDTQNQEFTC